MNLRSIGISHTSASVETREKMWMSPDEIREALKQLHTKFFDECMIVSTCNRTEVYGIPPQPGVNDLDLKQFLIGLKGATGLVAPDHFYTNDSGEAVNHLFQVAAGIDSMVIGDIQILGQVKEAFQLAQEMDRLGPVLNRLMQATLHLGKRVRTETSICEGAVSVSYAAVELASKIFEDLSRKSVLMIGAGETGELAAKHLAGKGIGDIRIANRTRAKAEALAAQLGGSAVDYEHLVDALRTADIVITSVTSPSYIVGPAEVHKVMKMRSNNPLFIIDIGVPRNVDPSCGKIENVFLYDLDSLSAVVDGNLKLRKAEIPRVMEIIRDETDAFFRWYNALQVGPTIHDLREALETIRREEVEKNINRFASQDRELLEMVTRRILNKLLHNPVTLLRQGAENGDGDSETLRRTKALRDLFGISDTGSRGESD